MAQVMGKVEAKSTTKFGYGILVGGKWYNSKDTIPANKGDVVKFENGGKNYVQALEIVTENTDGGGVTSPKSTTAPRSSYSRGVFPIPADDAQRSIVRQNSVTNAVSLMNILSSVLAEVDFAPIRKDIVGHTLAIARELEKYSAGDIDASIMKELDETFEVK